VTEELALEESLGERAAVEADDRRRGAGREVVDRMGDDLLAHTRFAQNEHVDRAGGDSIEGRYDLLEREKIHARSHGSGRVDEACGGRALQSGARRAVVRAHRDADGGGVASVGELLTNPCADTLGRAGGDVGEGDLEVAGANRREQIDRAKSVGEESVEGGGRPCRGSLPFRAVHDHTDQSEGRGSLLGQQKLLLQAHFEGRSVGEPEGGSAGRRRLDDEDGVADAYGVP